MGSVDLLGPGGQLAADGRSVGERRAGWVAADGDVVGAVSGRSWTLGATGPVRWRSSPEGDLRSVQVERGADRFAERSFLAVEQHADLLA